MKKCPRCEINYIEESETFCDICLDELKQNGEQKYEQALLCKNIVLETEIKKQITANQIFQAVRYLNYDYGEYNIYNTQDKKSYRNVLNNLLLSFRYAKKKYDCSAGFAYVFDEDEIWTHYFLANEDYKKIIFRRKINSFTELLETARSWLSLPHKSRRV